MKMTDLTHRDGVYAPSLGAVLFSKEGRLSWLVLIIGVLFSVFVSMALEQRGERNAEARFTLLTDQLAEKINYRLLNHENVLLAGAALFDVHEEVTREQWQTFTNRLAIDEHHPGIQGIGFAAVFQPEQLAVHEAQIRSEGFTEYQVRPSGVRDFYTAIVFLEPFSGRNLAAFGYDMYSEPTRSEAMQRAVGNNKTQISAKVTLVQETHGEQQAGFLMYVPIYQQGLPLKTKEQRWNALKGFVYSPYRMGDLMHGIIKDKDPGVEFSIFDAEVISEQAKLYQSAAPNSERVSHEQLRHIEAYGKVWTLRVFSRPAYTAEFNSPVDWLVPSFSLIITLLLAIILLQFKRRNAQAMSLAQAMSADLMRSERFLNSVLEAASGIAIIATDLNGTITAFNKGAENMLGHSRHDLIGKQTPALLHVEEEVIARAKELSDELKKPIEGFQVFVEKAECDGLEQREWTYIHKNGQQIRVLLTVTAIRDEQQNLIGFLGVAEDIRERKRIEEMKNQFVSTVSHELRTPLTSISGALDLVMTKRFGELSEKGTLLLANAHRNSKRLNHLINDILDIEKIAAGDMHFDMHAQNLYELLMQSVEAIQHYAQELNVQVVLKEVATDVDVMVDKQRFMQVMANLLSNAIKFSPKNSSVTVNSNILDQKVVVNVIDQGAGIADSFRHKIFQRFSQADGTDQRVKGGTGLGLAICRELMQRMSGRIDFESTEGEGSRFYIELPIAENDKVFDTNSAFEGTKTVKPRLLVLEDEPDVANLIATMLEDAGYIVDLAFTGTEALNKLNNATYDLMTVDLMLPDTNGLEVIQQVRHCPETRDIPIVVLSAIAEKGRLKIQGDASHIDWLAKPIQQESLLRTISQRLGNLNRPIQVLHVEDDYDLHHVISAMAGEGFQVGSARSLQEARAKVMAGTFDAIILDIGLPDGSGWELLPDIKQYQPQAYILVLSGRDVTRQELQHIDLAIRKSNFEPEQLIKAVSERLRR